MTRAQEMMHLAQTHGMQFIEDKLTKSLTTEQALKFLSKTRWHFVKCRDGSKYNVLVQNGRLAAIEHYQVA